jgi:hypothetical protein
MKIAVSFTLKPGEFFIENDLVVIKDNHKGFLSIGCFPLLFQYFRNFVRCLKHIDFGT